MVIKQDTRPAVRDLLNPPIQQPALTMTRLDILQEIVDRVMRENRVLVKTSDN